MKKILVVQTAFIGDVVLGLSVLQTLKGRFPDAEIHYLTRAGNESVAFNHPAITKIWKWEKRQNKISNYLSLLMQIRREKFDWVINLHRFFSSGFLTVFSGAGRKTGFDKNPLSFLFDERFPHEISPQNPTHEIVRNFQLLSPTQGETPERPRVYPSPEDYAAVAEYTEGKYYVLAPASVWFTKQAPETFWRALVENLPPDARIYLTGADSDFALCARLRPLHFSRRPSILNLCGKLSLLQTAALMEKAACVFTNDSAPLHLASAVNAPTVAFFCSTVPEFGFGPLSDSSSVVQTSENLPCRPCGLHGKKACPKGHFLCGKTLTLEATLRAALSVQRGEEGEA